MDLRSKGRASQQKGNPNRSAPTEKNVTHSPSHEQFVQTNSKNRRKQRENQQAKTENKTERKSNQQARKPQTTPLQRKIPPPLYNNQQMQQLKIPPLMQMPVQTLDQSAVSEPDIVYIYVIRERCGRGRRRR